MSKVFKHRATLRFSSLSASTLAPAADASHIQDIPQHLSISINACVKSPEPPGGWQVVPDKVAPMMGRQHRPSTLALLLALLLAGSQAAAALEQAAAPFVNNVAPAASAVTGERRTNAASRAAAARARLRAALQSQKLRQQLTSQRKAEAKVVPTGIALAPPENGAAAGPAPRAAVPAVAAMGRAAPAAPLAAEALAAAAPPAGAVTPAAAAAVVAAAGAGAAMASEAPSAGVVSAAAAAAPTAAAAPPGTSLMQLRAIDAAAAPAAADSGSASGAAAPAAAAPRRALPPAGAAFQYQLGEIFSYPRDLIPNVTVYALDAFDTPAETVARLRAAGAYPVCYFSTAYEDWRPDARDFPQPALGRPMADWPGERWVDVRAAGVRAMARRRMELCRDKGFLAVDPDNVDVSSVDTGFKISSPDQIAFVKYLADAAHGLGLAFALKNAEWMLGADAGVAAATDFAVNEQCAQYRECGQYAPLARLGRPVFNM